MKISLPIISHFIGKIDPLHLLVSVLSVFGAPAAANTTAPPPTEDTPPLLPLPAQAFSTTLWEQQTFAQQTALLNTLPIKPCPQTLKDAIEVLTEAPNPFNTHNALPASVDVKLTRYNLFKTTDNANMVIRRHAKIRKNIWGITDTSDEETDVLAEIKNAPPTLLRFKHDKNGDLTPAQITQEDISKHMRELENSTSGLIIEAKHDCDPGMIGDLNCMFEANVACYSHAKNP